MSALAFLASLGAGYLNEDEKKTERAKREAAEARQRQREDTADARATEVYNAGKAERELAVADRAALRTAATPDAVTPEAAMPETMDARDIGRPGEAKVPVTGYKVGAARFASEGVAAAETGRLAQQRTLQTLRAQGKHTEAAQIETQATQGELAKLQLTTAQAAAVQKQWSDKRAAAVTAAASGRPEALAQFMTESQADGLDGSSKWTHRVEGNELVLQPVGQDGKPINNGFRIPNDPDSLVRWGAMLDERTPLSEKLKDIRDTQRYKDQRDDRAADNTRADRQLTIQEQNGKAQQALLNMQKSQFKMTQAAAEAEARIPPAVKMQYATVDAELKQIGMAMAKSMAEGQYDPANKGTQELMLRQRELTTIAQRILSPYVQVPGAAAGKPGADPRKLFPEPSNAAPGAASANPASPSGKKGALPANLAAQGVQTVDPMAQRMAQESSELNRGTRTDFSPEIKQYVEQKRMADKAKAAADAEQALERERQQALARSRQQLGR